MSTLTAEGTHSEENTNDNLSVKHAGGKWSTEEDEKLKRVVKEHGPKNWKLISKLAFNGTRSDVQCLHRWQKVLRPGLVKGPWLKAEDDVILHLIKTHGLGNIKWSEIAANLPGRLGKQCRERWVNHLDPDLKKTPWTEEEDRILMEQQQRLGNKWRDIALALPGRSENSVKNRWNSTKRKMKRSERNAVDGKDSDTEKKKAPKATKPKRTKATGTEGRKKKASTGGAKGRGGRRGADQQPSPGMGLPQNILHGLQGRNLNHLSPPPPVVGMGMMNMGMNMNDLQSQQFVQYDPNMLHSFGFNPQMMLSQNGQFSSELSPNFFGTGSSGQGSRLGGNSSSPTMNDFDLFFSGMPSNMHLSQMMADGMSSKLDNINGFGNGEHSLPSGMHNKNFGPGSISPVLFQASHLVASDAGFGFGGNGNGASSAALRQLQRGMSDSKSDDAGYDGLPSKLLSPNDSMFYRNGDIFDLQKLVSPPPPPDMHTALSSSSTSPSLPNSDKKSPNTSKTSASLSPAFLKGALPSLSSSSSTPSPSKKRGLEESSSGVNAKKAKLSPEGFDEQDEMEGDEYFDEGDGGFGTDDFDEKVFENPSDFMIVGKGLSNRDRESLAEPANSEASKAFFKSHPEMDESGMEVLGLKTEKNAHQAETYQVFTMDDLVHEPSGAVSI